MLDTDLTSLLDPGASLVAGLVTERGQPFATRAWGATVRSTEPLELRVLLPTGSLTTAGFLPDRGRPVRFALTAADVATYRSVQMKGVAFDFGAAADDDLAYADRFGEGFAAAVHEADGLPIERVLRMIPVDLVACTVTVEELFDQTPGPGAGARLGPPPR